MESWQPKKEIPQGKEEPPTLYEKEVDASEIAKQNGYPEKIKAVVYKRPDGRFNIQLTSQEIKEGDDPLDILPTLGVCDDLESAIKQADKRLEEIIKTGKTD